MLSDIYNEFGWDIDYILTGVKKSYNPFSALIEKCPGNKRSEYINLIVWAIEQKLDDIEGMEENVVRSFKEKLNVTRLCSSAYSETVAEDSVLYNIRQNHGMSNVRMAQELDMSLRSYNWLEKGKCKPGVETFVLIDKKLGINPSFLMTGKFENMAAISEIWDKFEEQEKNEILTFLEQGLAFLCNRY
jgi:transcriptional regulator with XRE-family HTH domain